MVTASLLLNILVLIPVCFLIMAGGERAALVFGEATPARGILLALYVTILLASISLLVVDNPAATMMLLSMQVVYKVLTSFTVGTLRHPVVISNLAIAAFHAVTLGIMSGMLAT